jgi:hypothetical protein
MLCCAPTNRDLDLPGGQGMRFLLVFLLISGCLPFTERAAIAQQAAGRLSAEQRDIGRLETRIQRYDQALGVVMRLSRPQGDETECNGICFFPSSSHSVLWRCAPNDSCNLHCDVNPPVGGCH